MNYWLAIGPVGNWEIGLKKKIWGLGPRYDKAWNLIEPGDMVFFYAMAPVKGLVGCGTVSKKKFDEKPLWPQEVSEKATLWPFRVLLHETLEIPNQDWVTSRVLIDRSGIVFQRSFQPIDEKRAQKWRNLLAKAVESK